MVEVERVPGRAIQPGQERGGALQHPGLRFGAEHAREQPIVGKLALQVGERRGRSATDKPAESIRDWLRSAAGSG